MSNKAYLVCIGCFVVGVLIGAGGTYFVTTRYLADPVAPSSGSPAERQEESSASGGPPSVS